MKKIEILNNSKTIDYSNEQVENVWVKTNWLEAETTFENKAEETFLKIFKKIENSVICIQTQAFSTRESKASDELIKEIFNASSRGNKIYILTNKKEGILSNLVGACLVRYGQKNIGTLVLINPQVQDTDKRLGLVYSGDLTEASFSNSENLLMPIFSNDTQIDDLYRFFCNNFWKDATHEWLEENSEPKEVNIKLPFDFLPPYQNLCEPEFVRSHIKSKLSEASFVRVPEIKSDDFMQDYYYAEDCQIMCNYSADGFNGINSLEDLPENAEILATTDVLAMPYRMIECYNDDTAYFIPKLYLQPDDNIFAVKFTGEQYAKINSIKTNCNYEFGTFDKSDLGDKKIRFFDADEEVLIEEFGDVECEDVVLDEFVEQEKFITMEPNFEYAPTHPVETRYNWRTLPFYTPADAKEDNIYEEWQKCFREVKTSCDKGFKFVEALENKKQNSLQRLSRFFLGKSNQLQKYKKELEEIEKSIEENAGYNELDFKQKRDKLNQLLDILTEEAKEIDLQMDKANQEEEWEIKNKNLNGALAEIEEKIEANRQEKLNLEKQNQAKLDEIEQKLESERKADSQNKKDEESQAQQKDVSLEKLEQEIEKLERELEIHKASKPSANLSKKDRQRNIDTTQKYLISKRKELTNYNNKIDANSKKIEKIQKLEDDKKVLEKKFKDDLDKNTQELNRLESSKQQKQRELQANGSVFKYQENKVEDNTKKSSLNHLAPKNKNKSNNLSLDKAQEKIPSSKPKVGILKRQANQKFIEIEFWEEVEQAKLEAQRFNAKISVKQ